MTTLTYAEIYPQASGIMGPDTTARDNIVGAWTIQATPSAQNYYGAAYSRNTGRLVICGFGGTGNTLAYSDDGGLTWTSATSSDETSSWRTIAWGRASGGLFVLGNSTAGTGAAISTSSDGVNWTSRTIPNTADIQNIAWVEGEGMFVAVASSGTSRIFTSPDGITWTARTAPLLSYKAVTYASRYNRIVAVASSGVGNRVITSDDGGITWDDRTSPADISWASVAYSAFYDVLVMVANSGTGKRAAYSKDGGATWNLTDTTDDTQNWNSVCYSDSIGLFYACNSSSTGNRFMSSEDGIIWTQRTSPANMTYRAVIDLPSYGRFFAVSSTGTGAARVATSARTSLNYDDYVQATEYGLKGDGSDEYIAFNRVIAAAATGVKIDFGNLQINYGTTVMATQTAAIYLRGHGAKITYTGPQTAQSISITAAGYGLTLQSIEFDANSKTYCPLAVLQNTAASELPSLLVENCTFRNAYRDRTVVSPANQSCFNLYIRGGYAIAMVRCCRFFNSRLKDGFLDDGVTAASGLAAARHLSVLPGTSGPCESIIVEESHFEKVWCEDRTYWFDQDAIYVATSEDSTVTDMPRSTSATFRNNVFINSYGRNVKSQVVMTKIYDNVDIRTEGPLDSLGYPVQGYGQCYDFQVGGGMAWANEFWFYGASARDLFLHSGTREAPAGGIVQQLAEGPSVWGNTLYMSGCPALRSLMRLSTNYNGDTVMKLDDTKVVQSINAFVAGILATTMTVSSVSNGKLMAGQPITSGAVTGTTIVKQLTGPTGGIGTYQVSISQTVTPGKSMQSKCGIGSAVTTTSINAGDTATINLTSIRGDFINSFISLGNNTAATVSVCNSTNLGASIPLTDTSGTGTYVRVACENVDGITTPKTIFSRGTSGASWPAATSFGWESYGDMSTSTLLGGDGYRIDRYGNPAKNNVIEVTYDTTVSSPFYQVKIDALVYRWTDAGFGPRTANVVDLGSSSLTWKNVYAQNYYVGTNRVLSARGAAVSDIVVSYDFGSAPAVTGSVSIYDASAPSSVDLLKYCTELKNEIETLKSRLSASTGHGLIS